MIGKWFGKMKEIFLGEEIDNVGTEKQEHSKSTGRIINNQMNIEPKVIHRYPEGKFRFPLIPDETKRKNLQPTKEKKKSNHNSVPIPNKRSHNEKVDSQFKREKFTGINFKARDIPSPVYGFGERSLYQKKEMGYHETSDNNQLLDHDKSHRTFEPEQLSAVAIQQENIIVNNPTEQSLDIETVEYEIFEEQETSYIGSSELTQYDLMDDHVIVEQERDEYEDTENIAVNETPTSTDSIKIETRDPHELNFSEENISRHEQQPSNVTQTMQQNDSVKQTTNKSLHYEQQKQSEPKKHVPFNVLMLKQDRRYIKNERNKYQFPPIHLMETPSYSAENDAEWLSEQKELLQSTLQNFNVKAAVIGAVQGPAVTRLEVQPSPGVKVSKITNLSDDIKLSLSARDIRIEAPIPGRNAVGIEVPNLKSRPVPLREIIQSKEFRASTSPLTVALGLDISGQPVVTDLQKMPHGLIAGATGSGKSVCINSILISLFYKADPDEVKLLLVDPKMVELAPYNRIPHLVTPVITDAKEATNALKWTVDEMERRYEEFSHSGVRDIKRYNEVAKTQNKEKLPYIVVIIDELADLMMVSPHDVEEAICRIAQKARACGIHLLLATQRPSVDVITGLIKANIPTRTAFSVSSQVDSRTIIDTNGAEKLLGKGDMLFLENGSSKPQRIQGTFVSDEEIERITAFIRIQKEPEYLFEKEVLIQQSAFGDFEDDLFLEACEYVLEQGAASSSALQRRFRIGFNRAARLVEMMESKGIVSEAMGSKPRNILISKEEYEEQVLDS